MCYATYWFNDRQCSLGVNYHSFTWSSSRADFKLLDANIAVTASTSWKFILYAILNISIISNSSQISTQWNCFLSPLAICFLLGSYVFLWQWLCRTHHSREKHNGKYIFKVSCFICELNVLVWQIHNDFLKITKSKTATFSVYKTNFLRDLWAQPSVYSTLEESHTSFIQPLKKEIPMPTSQLWTGMQVRHNFAVMTVITNIQRNFSKSNCF